MTAVGTKPLAQGEESSSRLICWQVVTVALMVVGYSGYYLCRSNLSVALPLLITDLNSKGIAADVARIRLGSLASLGVLAYAVGKFPSGATADFFGGRRNFLSGMMGAVVFTLLFALGGGFPLFTVAWIGNRLIQSLGWAGMVKVTSKWFSYSSYGTVMGVISLSYLFGDAASRQFMAVLIEAGFGWRALFGATAAVLGGLFVLNALLLKESPRRVRLQEPASNPLSLFAGQENNPAPASIRTLLKPFLQSRVFWLVCLLSLGMTLVRETFNLWTPTYFTDVVGLTKADAASKSALFPLLGGFSVLLAGFLSDRIGPTGRAATIVIGLILTSVALFALGGADFHHATLPPVLLVAGIGFFLIGPYAYLGGAIALDFGGKQGSATASGLIDGIGYLGGVLAGDSIARVSVAYGWSGAFDLLGLGVVLTAAAGGVYWFNQSRSTLATQAGATQTPAT